MKRLLSLIAIALLSLPILAQDDFGGGGTLSTSEIDALFGGGGRGGGRGNQGRNNVQSSLPDPVVMFTQLKDLLKTKKTPLVKEQEKPLQTLLNDETKAIRTDLETRFPQLNPNNQNNQNNQNQQGNRGNQGNNNDFMVRMDPIITKHNDELLTGMK